MAPEATDRKSTAILFVCLGNICRSALAEGIVRNLAEERGLADMLTIDSAGTGSWHVGEPPDSRAIAKAAQYVIDISEQRGRQVAQEDFDRFDLMLAMDGSNLQTLHARSPNSCRAGLNLFMDYTVGRNEDVPDPYYGGPDGFETVFRMIERGGAALLDGIKGAR
ncbi:MAG: low molecular weight phosphotyrosine protein phosphatase [Hyphomicrobiales bacterium]|nr:low molecular weight phosphotyrosine protein phosphatase [Hyphomicrobiales bacterium]MCP4997322.1 low molecular weight phosphotyrosine protein phosphatase [Hyphomicrobiales bacterium]